jgi:hypothetical protein
MDTIRTLGLCSSGALAERRLAVLWRDNPFNQFQGAPKTQSLEMSFIKYAQIVFNLIIIPAILVELQK